MIIAVAVSLDAINVAEKFIGPGSGADDNLPPWPVLVKVTLAYWLVAGALFPFVRFLASRLRLDDSDHRWRNAVLHIVFAAAFSFLYLAGGRLLGGGEWGHMPLVPDLARQVRTYGVFGLVLYVCMLGGIYSTGYFKEAQQRAVAASRLEASLAQAELRAIRSRLNPHFLFNALHAIAGLALTRDPDTVAEMLGRLSDLLRRSVDDLSSPEVTLQTCQPEQLSCDYLETRAPEMDSECNWTERLDSVRETSKADKVLTVGGEQLRTADTAKVYGRLHQRAPPRPFIT